MPFLIIFFADDHTSTLLITYPLLTHRFNLLPARFNQLNCRWKSTNKLFVNAKGRIEATCKQTEQSKGA